MQRREAQRLTLPKYQAQLTRIAIVQHKNGNVLSRYLERRGPVAELADRAGAALRGALVRARLAD